MQKIYEQISRRLEQLDLDAIWKGFSQCEFALYDDEQFFLGGEYYPLDSDFRGNTSIQYKGRYIAIWHIQEADMEDWDILTSNLVHEMFHVYQENCGENRFPDDIALMYAKDASAVRYNLKYQENQQLIMAAQSQNIKDKIEYFNQFIQIRKYRQQISGSEIIEEYKAETIEGMAEYAGTMALRQLSVDKYLERLSEVYKRLSEVSSAYFDTRKMAYDTGSLMCLILKDLEEHGENTGFFHLLGVESRTVFQLCKLNNQKTLTEYNSADYFNEIYSEYVEQKRNMVKEFQKKTVKHMKGEMEIIGYDPMNMMEIDGQILCTHFVVLQAVGCEEPISLTGQSLLKIEPGEERIVTDVWYKERTLNEE